MNPSRSKCAKAKTEDGSFCLVTRLSNGVLDALVDKDFDH